MAGRQTAAATEQSSKGTVKAGAVAATAGEGGTGQVQKAGA